MHQHIDGAAGDESVLSSGTRPSHVSPRAAIDKDCFACLVYTVQYARRVVAYWVIFSVLFGALFRKNRIVYSKIYLKINMHSYKWIIMATTRQPYYTLYWHERPNSWWSAHLCFISQYALTPSPAHFSTVWRWNEHRVNVNSADVGRSNIRPCRFIETIN